MSKNQVGSSILWGASIDISTDVSVDIINTQPIHRLAMCREFIRVEHPPMLANTLIVILLVPYRQKHIGQIPVDYQWYTGQLLVLYRLQETVDR